MRPYAWQRGQAQAGKSPLRDRDPRSSRWNAGRRRELQGICVRRRCAHAPSLPAQPAARQCDRGTAAPQEEQNRSPVFRIDRQTWQVTRAPPFAASHSRKTMAEQAVKPRVAGGLARAPVSVAWLISGGAGAAGTIRHPTAERSVANKPRCCQLPEQGTEQPLHLQRRLERRNAVVVGASPCAMGAEFYIGHGGRRISCY